MGLTRIRSVLKQHCIVELPRNLMCLLKNWGLKRFSFHLHEWKLFLSEKVYFSSFFSYGFLGPLRFNCLRFSMFAFCALSVTLVICFLLVWQSFPGLFDWGFGSILVFVHLPIGRTTTKSCLPFSVCRVRFYGQVS